MTPNTEGRHANPQVKGLTFVTARRFFTTHFGEDVYEGLVRALPAGDQELFDNAQIDEWYDEHTLRRFIHEVYIQVAEADDAYFMQILRELALAGVSRFFRVLINFASARFVLKKVPVVWDRLRRGPATLHAEVVDEETIRIHYDGFPFCGDRVYRMLSVCNCQALVVAACKRVPECEVTEWTENSMVLQFTVPKSKGFSDEGDAPGSESSTDAGVQANAKTSSGDPMRIS